MYGLNFPYNALAIYVHLFLPIFWRCLRNHMFRWSILDQNAEKCGRRYDWLFLRSMTKQVKNGKTVILRVDFRWLYINVGTETTSKIQKNPEQNDFVLTGSSQTVVFKNRQKWWFLLKGPSNRIVSVVKTHQKMIFFDVNEKALQKGSKFACQKCRKKYSKFAYQISVIF